MRFPIRYLVVGPVAALLFATCGVEGTSFLVSDATEAEIGAEVHQQVLAEYPLFNDPTAQAWLSDIGARIANVSTSERAGVNYTFYVLDTEIVNAFAAPGGYLYATRGLILQSQSEAEVFGVMAHEVAHVAHRHGVARLERAALTGVVTDLFFGDGIAADVVTFVSDFVLSTSYSRDQEVDSDLTGVGFVIAAGVNPYGMVAFFETLAALNAEAGVSVPEWMSSHPDSAQRAIDVTAEIQRLVPGLTASSPEYTWDVTGQFDQIQNLVAF